MTVLIPAYKPDEKLISTVEQLRTAAPEMRVLVVDDGGGETYAPIFTAVSELGAVVLKHKVNRGKGAAMKTGFEWLMANGETEGCVTADADGQHLTEDILKVTQKLRESSNALVLGGRKFNKKSVPLKSKFGNYCTRFTYNLLCGQCVGDTQTGLRGIPASLFKTVASIPGDRYEYEMQQLLRARSLDIDIVETEIHTVYIDEENTSSHFNPFKDAARVYGPVLGAGSWLIVAAVLNVLSFKLIYPLFGLFYASLISWGIAFVVRSIDLFARRRGRLVKPSKLIDYLMVWVFEFVFSVTFGYLLGGTFGWRNYAWRLIGDAVYVAYICVIKGIKIRRIK